MHPLAKFHTDASLRARFLICPLLGVCLACCLSGSAGAQMFDPTDPQPGFGFSEVNFLPPAQVVVGAPAAPRVGASFDAPRMAKSVRKEDIDAYKTVFALGDGPQALALRQHMDPSMNGPLIPDDKITHQPLIHVKIRVVEVQRTNGFSAASILEYVSTEGTQPTFTTGRPLNDDPAGQNFKGLTQFDVPGLVDDLGIDNGSGALINLTSRHINWIASFLGTEFNADTITAPQVTTLNGKNVTFRAGSQVPFELGQNRILGNNNNVQQFFYKPVGTYVSVTPQIVNWDEVHGGLGEAKPSASVENARDDALKGMGYVSDNVKHLPVEFTDIKDDDYFALLVALRDGVVQLGEGQTTPLRTLLHRYAPDFNVAVLHELPENRAEFALQNYGYDAAKILALINQLLKTEPFVDRFTLAEATGGMIKLPRRLLDSPCMHCNWKASDCTINLNIAVRLSEVGTSGAIEVSAGQPVEATRTSEQNVRAISNMVQVKSGNGVVMGGLISMKDSDAVAKVPFLGDLPFVGAAFRSTKTEQIKTETLIFVEAEVLPGYEGCCDECGRSLAAAKTAEDFCNAKTHLNGDLCQGVLNQGLHRSGLAGDYLPPPTCGELDYWRKYHRAVKHKRSHTVTREAIDLFQ